MIITDKMNNMAERERGDKWKHILKIDEKYDISFFNSKPANQKGSEWFLLEYY
jgi:hypothetical protein